MRKALLCVAALAMLPTGAGAKPEPGWLAIEGRASADAAQDAGRRPVETLKFLGIRRGDAALDYMAGGGYYAEIMARAVGPKGKVVAWNPAGFVSSDRARAKWAALGARTANLTHVTAGFDQFDAPANSYDFALFHLVYHDLYWQSDEFSVPRTDPDAVLRRLFVAMKPGGIVGVVDHYGNAGDTRSVVDAVHRIDPAVVRADFDRAGFRLVSESRHLRVEGDDYSKSVFDPALRGKTDRFVMKFIKPKQ
jgi:predicted methyltransferase